LAKIAVMGGVPERRILARGDGWTVSDVVCTSGPRDRRFEEQHTASTIAIVVAGSFQYRSPAGREVMTPGSLLVGVAGHCFECGHEHATGDHCISFQYASEHFDAAPLRGMPRIPPVRPTSALISRAVAGLRAPDRVSWEEIGFALAALALRATGRSPMGAPFDAEARVTRVVRMLDEEAPADTSLGRLAAEANLSRYHFLRTFERVTGVTPHQYVLRTRLRRAAVRLATESSRVIDVALDLGFRDLSNFNRAFRAEFGVSPRAYRRPR
jgi:AraC family transcriptional regulator